MKVRPLFPGLCALALCLGCDDSGGTSEPAQPSLRLLSSGECGGYLPIPAAAELSSGTFRTVAVSVGGTDPGASNMLIRNQTEVELLQTVADANGPTQVVAFVSAFQDATMSGVMPGAALPQAAQSKGVRFLGSAATDRVFCIAPGVAFIDASIPNYAGGGGFVGSVSTPQNQRVQILCVTPEAYAAQCNPPDPPDSDLPEAGVEEMGVEADAGDMGVVSDGATAAPSLWTIKFLPPEDPTSLQIGIRNSGLGERDNTELVFQVAELDRPLPDVLVKFFLDDITQPGATISGGNASLFEEGSEVVVSTPSDGTVRVRLIAGGSPGLAAVRAVALRFDRNDLRGCEATDYNCLFEAYCGRNLSRIDQAPECEQDRSRVVTIAAGIPSGRNLHLVCLPDVFPAFTYRQPLRGLDQWELSNEDGPLCFTQIADRVSGRVKEGTGVFFLTEAGTMTEISLSDVDGRAASQMRIGRDPPQDVTSDEYELAAGFPEEGYNPRDGLARVVMFTRGEEAFFDANGDNVYAEADGDFQLPGQDLPEPFVDADDDGDWDITEYFQDSNNNGVWDDANGIWDGSTDIWTSVTVLWVGDLFSCHEDLVGGVVTGSPSACADTDLIPEALQTPVASFRCGDNCREEEPFNPLCGGAAFFLDPATGGNILLTLRLTDINGNCINGKGTMEYEVSADGLVIIGSPLKGSVRCAATAEQPLGEILEYQIFDPRALPDDPPISEPNMVGISVKYDSVYGAEKTLTASVPVCR